MMWSSIDRDQVNTHIIFTRLFDASICDVFNACTDEKQIAQWWGPYGFTNPVCHWNACENGSIYVDMTASDGMVFPMTGIFHEIEIPRKIVFTSKAFEDDDGNIQLEVLNTVSLLSYNKKTKFILDAKVMKATPLVKQSLEGMQEGWSQSLDKLENFLQTKLGA